MRTLDAARVYARIAVLRRRVLVGQILIRIAAGAIAVVAALVALGFGTAALYVWLAGQMGAIGAAAIVAALWLLLAIALAAFAASAPHSAELDALEKMEGEAKLNAELSVARLTSIGARAESMSGALAASIGVLRVLRTLFGRRR